MGSNSKIPSIGFPQDDDNAELMASFRNLGLRDGGETGLNHGFEVGCSSLSVSSEQGSQKEEIFYGEQANNGAGAALWKRALNSCAPETQPELPIYQKNIWAYHDESIDGVGSDQPSSYQKSGSGNFTCKTKDGSNYLGYDPVTSPRSPLSLSYSSYGPTSTYAQTPYSSSPNYDCMPNFLSQLNGAPWCDDQACYYNYAMGENMLNGYDCYPTNGVSGCNGYNLQNIGGTGGGSVLDCFPKGVDLGMVAKTSDGSHMLHKLFGTGDYKTRKWILVGLFDSIPELMTDANGHHVFQKLISSSNDYEFSLIVGKLTSENRFLLDAAFDKQGSYSVQKFIKKLKKSPMASTVTSILSTRFFEMMTHSLARHVIKQCLNILGFQPNVVLYEAAINNCYTLAVNKTGCLSINDCIDFITGAQREMLLQCLADESAYLASDPSGNFVVQHVLKTRNPLVIDRVCHSLRGHYRQVSAKKGGSHVIEMCVAYSSLGMNLAVQEFLENPKELVQLAKDQFGNYVVQKLLKVTKLENIQLYEALVEALKPHIRFLEHYKTGKSVVALMRRNLNQLETNELGQKQASL